MVKKIILYFIISFIGFNLFAQEIKVIELEPVEIVPSDQILVYSNFSKKHKENKAEALGSGLRGKIAIVSGFLNPEKSSIQLEGLEFFFNYDWEQDSSGFYIQPVVVREKDGLPMLNYTDFPEKYLVTGKLKNRLFIDLSTKGISLSPQERVYVGIMFLENVNPKTPYIFNFTAISGKILEYTYLLYPDGRKPQEVVGPGKHSAGLKYSVVYKLKE
jgi:hypothetical protein